MADRRSFLGAVTGVAASVLLAPPSDAQTGTTPPARPSPALPPPSSPKPGPSVSPKPPSALAAATAASMRRFDPALTDADVVTIAAAIDANRDGTAQLNSRKSPLANGDEPVTRFAVVPAR